ncbi:NAD(P)-dependent oxidoreductase [Ornithinimicrobium pratense]|uniref:NAD(P)H-binding protein n=1 Tax=Ornithinimicrobium pratense TaxID=2593973 RepID=A0A5J6V9T6_9MICO|nr:NAD(P)H-binding protein [Ornithinimicrobium pratense]QFG69943.1 NAD(P)H-binding protein [Ornithinimicrobium pratense]
MRIAIIGGHGKIALELHPLLSRAGHEVDAIIRNPDQQADIAELGATPVVADVQSLSTEELTELLRGHDVVLWSAGAGGGDPERTFAVDRDAAIRTMDAASAAGVARYLIVSYLGATTDHGVPEDNPFFAYAEAKAAADEHLRGTDLAWTIVAPGALSLEAPTGHLLVVGYGPDDTDRDPSVVGESQVSRADVARVLAAVVERDDLGGVMIEFVNGPTPIAEALDAAAQR